MMRLFLVAYLFILSIYTPLFSQVELYIHQPNCEVKTVVNIANGPQYKSSIIDKETELFIVDSPQVPKQFVFFIDTMGIMIEKFWVEPSTKRIDFYLYNCRAYRFTVDNPNELTRAARASSKYVDYLYEKAKGDDEFQVLYNEYKVNFILEHPDSYLSLASFEQMRISDERKIELLETLGEKNKAYPLYQLLLNKYNGQINQDSLDLDLQFVNINNDTLHFKMFKDRPVVFVFWMSGCKWSTKLLPDIVALDRANEEVDFVYYCLDENRMQWQNSSKKYEIPDAFNISELSGYLGRLPVLFNVDRTPYFVVADESQKIGLVTFGDELELVEKEIEGF